MTGALSLPTRASEDVRVTQQSALAHTSNGPLQIEIVPDALPASKRKEVKNSRSWSSNGIQTTTGHGTIKRVKKRRKVNHGMTSRRLPVFDVVGRLLTCHHCVACLYCRRSVSCSPGLRRTVIEFLSPLREASLADNATHV